MAGLWAGIDARQTENLANFLKKSDEEDLIFFENCIFHSYIALKLALSACSDPDGHF